jgi:hypothetical protein
MTDVGRKFIIALLHFRTETLQGSLEYKTSLMAVPPFVMLSAGVESRPRQRTCALSPSTHFVILSAGEGSPLLPNEHPS